jgi:hypothetical protein
MARKLSPIHAALSNPLPRCKNTYTPAAPIPHRIARFDETFGALLHLTPEKADEISSTRRNR